MKKNGLAKRLLVLLPGFALIAAGIIGLIARSHVVQILPVLVSIPLFALGVQRIYSGVQYRRLCAQAKRRNLPVPMDAAYLQGAPSILQGVINLAMCGVLLFNRQVSLLFLGILLGLWLLITGGMSLYMGWTAREQTGVWGFLDGGAKVLLALYTLCLPLRSLTVFITLLSLSALVAGIGTVISGWSWTKS